MNVGDAADMLVQKTRVDELANSAQVLHRLGRQSAFQFPQDRAFDGSKIRPSIPSRTPRESLRRGWRSGQADGHCFGTTISKLAKRLGNTNASIFSSWASTSLQNQST
jgi:hypothetical protein